MTDEKNLLICMRLADMKRVHPDQITDKCTRCGETVGIYPSGQRVLNLLPGQIEIVCHVCRPEPDVTMLAPGAEFEPFESRKKS
jgi:hypothetical protein